MKEHLKTLIINYQHAAVKLRLAGAWTLAEIFETKIIEMMETLNEVPNQD